MNTVVVQFEGSKVLLRQSRVDQTRPLSTCFSALNLSSILLFCAIGTRFTAATLHVIIVDPKSLIHFGAKRSLIIDPGTMLASENRRILGERDDLQS